MDIKSQLYSYYLDLLNEISSFSSNINRSYSNKNLDFQNLNISDIIINIKEATTQLLNDKVSEIIALNKNNKNYYQLENYTKKIESDLKYYLRLYFEYKIQNDALEEKIRIYRIMQEDFEELKEKVKKSSLNKIKILSQTTFNEEKFNELSNKINEYFPNYEVDIDNTICNATHERQEETKEIAKQVDYMKIIGGKNSSNTKELYNVAKDFCKNVALIQDVKDLANESLNNYSRIGIIAGASTSESSINEVVEFLKSI